MKEYSSLLQSKKIKRAKVVFKKLVWLFLVFIIFCNVSYYHKTEFKNCNVEDQKILNEITVDKEALPPELDQGATPTCFAHVAYYLLQFFYNIVNASNQMKFIPGSHPTAHQKEELSIWDVLTQGCKEGLNKTGNNSYVPLHNLRDKPIFLKNNNSQNEDIEFIDVENVLEIDKKIKDKSQTPQDIAAFITNLKCSKGFTTQSSEITKLVAQLNRADAMATYRILSEIFIKGNPQHAKLPLYNVEVFDLTANKPDEIERIKSRYKEQMKKMLQPKPPYQKSFPVGIGFCPETDDEGRCLEGHSVTITGVRTICCKDVCQEEWNILNSYGPDAEESGWHKTDPIVESMAKYSGNMVAITPCKPKELIKPDDDPTPECKQHIIGPNPIHYLINAKDIDGLMELRKEKEFLDKINSSNQQGISPLNLAILRGYDELIVPFLIKNGANVNMEDQKGWTPLLHAVNLGNENLFQLLYTHGANINYINSHGITLLMQTATKDAIANINLAKLLLEKNAADINAISNEGFTALAIAVKNGNLKMIELLLLNGAKTDLKIHTKTGEKTILELAPDTIKETIKLLFDKLPKPLPLRKSIHSNESTS